MQARRARLDFYAVLSALLEHFGFFDDDIVICRGHDAVARLVNFVQSVFEFGIFGFSFLQKPYVTHKREIIGNFVSTLVRQNLKEKFGFDFKIEFDAPAPCVNARSVADFKVLRVGKRRLDFVHVAHTEHFATDVFQNIDKFFHNAVVAR